MNTAPLRAEEWRPIPGLPGYEASTLGNIRSLDRTLPAGKGTRRYTGRVLNPRPKPGAGYLSFYTDGGRYVMVNRAVAAAFHGPPPTEDHEAAHRDGDLPNNTPGNIVWTTPVENEAMKREHGTAPIGERNGRARLQEVDIPVILACYARGLTAPDLAETFGVSPRAILNVVAGKSWGHVASGYRALAAAQTRLNIEAALRLGRQRR